MKPGILPPPTPAQVKAQKLCELVMDAQGRTAIVLERGKDETKFLPMDPTGVFVTYASSSVFRARFPFTQTDEKAPKALRVATVHAAARCYVTHATFAGASGEAVAELKRLVPVTPKEEEQIMAAKKNQAPKTEEKVTKVKAAAPRAAVKTGGAGEKKTRSGAAATFRELIMAGNKTDDQIFAEVQKRHPEVGDDKRPYVAWYRNDLKKKGKNPPAPKKSLKD